MNRGNKKPQKYDGSHSITFNDVGGNEHAKNDLREICHSIKYPDQYKDVGFSVPRGILFYGPPGTGKTLMAKALANECQIDFIHACGSDFVELYVGNGAKRVRDLFDQARKSKPCIVFIDEIDSLARSRSSLASCREADSTLNQLLSEMDGFKDSEGIVVVAATNQVDQIDDAILRPGRFDRKVEIKLPSEEDRFSILEIHLKSRKHEVTRSKVLEIAQQTPGLSGSELECIINEAASQAIRDY